MDYKTAVALYLDYLIIEQGATERTKVTYQSWLNRYGHWLKEAGYKSQEIDVVLTEELLRKYQYQLSQGTAGGTMESTGKTYKPLRPRSVRGAFHAIKGLCVYLKEKRKCMDAEPWKNLKLPKKDAAKRNLISDDEVSALLVACDRQGDRRMAAFDFAMMSTLCYTGIRAQELIDLRLSDLNRGARKLTVAQGKGLKARTLTPPARFWTAMDAWLAERAKMGCTHDWVWAQDKGRRIGYDWLRERLKDIQARAGLMGQDNIHAHSLRHWFATHMLRAGANIKQIQASLGHANAVTTQIYIHSDEADADAMEEFADFDPFAAGTGLVTVPALPAESSPMVPQSPAPLPLPGGQMDMQTMMQAVQIAMQMMQQQK